MTMTMVDVDEHDEEMWSILDSTTLCAGMNYLIDRDSTVYGITVDAFSGARLWREVWRRDHRDYLLRYRTAVLGTGTLFMKRDAAS